MSDPVEVMGWGEGHTAEDFANMVHQGLGEEENGVVAIPFEDYTLPDHIVFMGGLEIQGHELTWIEFLSGATKYFHSIEAKSFRAVETGATTRFTAYGMALQLTVERVPEPAAVTLEQD